MVQGAGTTTKLTLDTVAHEKGDIMNVQTLEMPHLGDGVLDKEMAAAGVEISCSLIPRSPPPNLGAGSPLANGNLTVYISSIGEVFSPILKGLNLDFLSNDFEWMVPKRKNRGGIKANVGSSVKAAPDQEHPSKRNKK